MDDLKAVIGRISDAATEAKQYKSILAQIVSHIKLLDQKLRSNEITKDQYDTEIKKIFQDRDRNLAIKQMKDYINIQIVEIEKDATLIEDYFGKEISIAPTQSSEKVNVGDIVNLDKATKKQFLKDVNIDEDLLEEFSKRAKQKKLAEVRIEYTVYKTTQYGIMANRIFGKLSNFVVTKYPILFQGLYQSLRMSGLKVMSKTYISIIFLNSLIGFFIGWIGFTFLWSNPSIIVQILRGFGLGIVSAIATGGVSFFYPGSKAKEKDSLIKNELPFVIIHMSAVAGSGAKPISIFSTILSTEEYPATKDEINKIVNYVNLFGYDLSTALKAVSKVTPSLQLKDLLSGIVNNIESGGDLKQYLSTVADEALNRYRLERQKYVEVVATYSDVYTALLIAAPLLFFVTLAIIQTLGGQVAGVPVSTIAIIGTYIAIPIMNVGYYFFVDTVVPK